MAEHIIIPDDCEVITKGHSSNIYLISDDVVVKAYNYFFNEEFVLEYKIQGEILDAGYPVPRTYGMSPIILPNGKCNPMAFQMERIYGRDLEDIADNEEMMGEARKIVHQIGMEMGVYIHPAYGLKKRNVMFDEVNNRVVLIDFGYWNYSDLAILAGCVH